MSFYIDKKLFIRKQDGVHLYGIQMVRQSGIQMAFKNYTIWHPNSFQPFEYQTSSLFKSPLYFIAKISQIFKTVPDTYKIIELKGTLTDSTVKNTGGICFI